MPSMNIAGQVTDGENSKPSLPAVNRTNDLRSVNVGSAQDIARRDDLRQQNITGAGGDAVTASIK